MKTLGASLLVAAALSVLTGCSKYESRSEVEWAKSALARNPAFAAEEEEAHVQVHQSARER